MTIDEEWNEYFGGAAFKSEHTVKSYKNSHKRITSYIGKPIAKGSVGELIEAVANLSEKAYIINFLLINYNTRNADLDVEFVNSIHTTKANKKRNYIVSRKNDFVYIRNDYKTFSKYGQKRFIFKSVPFGRAVKYLVAQHAPNERVFLLDREGLQIDPSSIGNYIKKYTYKNLTEGDYNKIAVSAITDIADIKQLEQMGDRRGTDLKTLITYYNIPYSEKTWGKY